MIREPAPYRLLYTILTSNDTHSKKDQVSQTAERSTEARAQAVIKHLFFYGRSFLFTSRRQNTTQTAISGCRVYKTIKYARRKKWPTPLTSLKQYSRIYDLFNKFPLTTSTVSHFDLKRPGKKHIYSFWLLKDSNLTKKQAY